jgi:hypothetical protein
MVEMWWRREFWKNSPRKLGSAASLALGDPPANLASKGSRRLTFPPTTGDTGCRSVCLVALSGVVTGEEMFTAVSSNCGEAPKEAGGTGLPRGGRDGTVELGDPSATSAETDTPGGSPTESGFVAHEVEDSLVVGEFLSLSKVSNIRMAIFL